MFSGVIMQKEDRFCTSFCAGHWPTDIPLWMVSSCCVVVKDVMVQLVITLTGQLSYPPAIGPTLGARFSLLWAYYSCIGVAWALGLRQWTENEKL